MFETLSEIEVTALDIRQALLLGRSIDSKYMRDLKSIRESADDVILLYDLLMSLLERSYEQLSNNILEAFNQLRGAEERKSVA